MRPVPAWRWPATILLRCDCGPGRRVHHLRCRGNRSRRCMMAPAHSSQPESPLYSKASIAAIAVRPDLPACLRCRPQCGRLVRRGLLRPETPQSAKRVLSGPGIIQDGRSLQKRSGQHRVPRVYGCGPRMVWAGVRAANSFSVLGVVAPRRSVDQCNLRAIVSSGSATYQNILGRIVVHFSRSRCRSEEL